MSKGRKSYLLGVVMFTGLFALLRFLAERSDYDDEVSFLALMEFEYMVVYMSLFPIVYLSKGVPHKDVKLFLGTAGLVLLLTHCYSERYRLCLLVLGFVFIVSKTFLVVNVKNNEAVIWYTLSFAPFLLLHSRF